jgi:hypothetical protein
MMCDGQPPVNQLCAEDVLFVFLSFMLLHFTRMALQTGLVECLKVREILRPEVSLWMHVLFMCESVILDSFRRHQSLEGAFRALPPFQLKSVVSGA